MQSEKVKSVLKKFGIIHPTLVRERTQIFPVLICAIVSETKTRFLRSLFLGKQQLFFVVIFGRLYLSLVVSLRSLLILK